MNDAFLYQSRPALRPRFADQVWERLEGRPGFWQAVRRFLGTRRGFATALLTLVALAACAQQILNSTFHHVINVSGISIYESHDLLMVDASDYVRFGLEEREQSSGEPGEWPTMPLEEALALLPYEIEKPTWVPEGFELSGRVYENRGNWDFAFALTWYSQERDAILPLVTHQGNGSSLQEAHVYPGQWEILEINGTDVVAIRGAFDMPFETRVEAQRYLDAGGGPVEQIWNSDLGTTLMWSYEDVFYTLQTPVSPFPWDESRRDSYLVPEEDLLRMAASMIPDE